MSLGREVILQASPAPLWCRGCALTDALSSRCSSLAACSCHPVGSAVLPLGPRTFCDPSTGDCPCKPGVAGPRCDHCLPGYWGFSAYGCRPCDCARSCDPHTGDCHSSRSVGCLTKPPANHHTSPYPTIPHHTSPQPSTPYHTPPHHTITLHTSPYLCDPTSMEDSIYTWPAD